MSVGSRGMITALLVGIACLPLPAAGQQAEPLTLENDQAEPVVARDAEGVWTPTELQSAEPMELPRPDYQADTIQQLEEQLDRISAEEAEPQGEGIEEFRDGASPPEGAIQPDSEDMLFQPPASTEEVIEAQSEIVPLDEGTMRAPFSSSQLVPLSGRLVYPYSTVGKLFFQTPQGPSWCSAAVLRPRLLLTAGHCVHRGSGGANGWFSNWLFAPAYENAQAPFQTWDWRWVIVTGSWANSGGSVPNQADFAILELEDRRFDSNVRRIGDVVGYLGYHTNILQRNHTKKLGYPGNLDRGEVMHQVDSGNFRDGGSNTVLYGSDARGGSSGGPWVMNFGAQSQGQTGGLRPWPNRIVGVTSYGYIDPAPKVQGSSILNNEFLNILNTACNHRPGNC